MDSGGNSNQVLFGQGEKARKQSKEVYSMAIETAIKSCARYCKYLSPYTVRAASTETANSYISQRQ
jgi:hypothetical protein